MSGEFGLVQAIVDFVEGVALLILGLVVNAIVTVLDRVVG